MKNLLVVKTAAMIDHALTGANLRELRLRRRASLTDVAKALKIQPSTLCLLEKGKRQWTQERVRAFADYINGLP